MKRGATFSLILIPIIFVFLATSCNKVKEHQSAGNSTSEMVAMDYAMNFMLVKEGEQVQLGLVNAVGEGDTSYYRLENSPSSERDSKNVIPSEINRVVVMSSPHAAMLEALGLSDKIVGISNPSYYYSDAVQKGVESGKIKTLGFAQNINKELLLTLQPDLMIISGNRNALAPYQFLIDQGVPVLTMNAWMENTPLGRAEWIKVLGMIFHVQSRADSLFTTVEKGYSQLLNTLDTVKNLKKPTVLLNAPYKGTWYVAGGESYMAKLLEDAGTDYLWKDDSAIGALPLDYESVYEKAISADVWINPGNVKTKAELLESDDRYANFKSVKTNELYSNLSRVKANGGNDYYESGMIHPDEVLADLIYMFHPEVLPAHQLKYFKVIE